MFLRSGCPTFSAFRQHSQRIRGRGLLALAYRPQGDFLVRPGFRGLKRCGLPRRNAPRTRWRAGNRSCRQGCRPPHRVGSAQRPAGGARMPVGAAALRSGTRDSDRRHDLGPGLLEERAVRLRRDFEISLRRESTTAMPYRDFTCGNAIATRYSRSRQRRTFPGISSRRPMASS
jgi:hypothetical protein